MKRFLIAVCLLLQVSPTRAAEFIWSGKDAPFANLYMLGEMVAGDTDRFLAALRERGARPFALFLRSGGGSLDEGLKIGRIVRKLSITTYTPIGTNENPFQASCEGDVSQIGQVPAQCICASACTFIWFAGVSRYGLAIHVHSIRNSYFAKLSPDEAQTQYRRVMDEVRSYLHDMDVDDKYYYWMNQTISSDLKRVAISDDPALFGWAPGYREWLLSKCGNFNSGNNQEWANCSMAVANDAQVKSLSELLGNSSQPGISFRQENPGLPTPTPVALPDTPPRSVNPDMTSLPVQSPPQRAIDQRTSWIFYESKMYLEKHGSEWAMYFDVPRSSFAREGVVQGSTFFKGQADGDRLQGFLSYYTKGCPTIAYSVSGSVINAGRKIVLSGTRPTRDTECAATGSRDVTVTFETAELQEARSAAEVTPFIYNGSIFSMTKSGSQRVFKYDSPREGLADAGIARGSVLFRGTLEATKFVGMGLVYTKNCPTLEYEMSGSFAENGQDIILTGQRPVRDKDCNLKRYTAAQIKFEPYVAD